MVAVTHWNSALQEYGTQSWNLIFTQPSFYEHTTTTTTTTAYQTVPRSIVRFLRSEIFPCELETISCPPALSCYPTKSTRAGFWNILQISNFLCSSGKNCFLLWHLENLLLPQNLYKCLHVCSILESLLLVQPHLVTLLHLNLKSCSQSVENLAENLMYPSLI